MGGRCLGIPGVTLPSVGGGEGPCQRTPGRGGGRPGQAVGATAASGRSGQPGPIAAFFFSMMPPA
jgi:hypothetical protein